MMTMGFVLIFLALAAYLSVHRLSDRLLLAGEMHATCEDHAYGKSHRPFGAGGVRGGERGDSP